MGKITSKSLFDVFNKAKTKLNEWQHFDGQTTEFAGEGGYKVISKSLATAFIVLIDASADVGLEPADLQAKRCIMAIDEFGPLFASWLRRYAVQAANPTGESALWEAWARVEEAFEPLKERYEHSVKYLIDVANAPREQIARMYGWLDSDGIPQVEKVQEEFDAPGTHFDKATWVSPSMAARRALIEKQWSERKQPRGPLFDPQESETPKGVPVAPPSLEVLLENGAPPEQMARLHAITVEDAMALKLEYDEAKALKALNGEKVVV